jgi:hypothetical protein
MKRKMIVLLIAVSTSIGLTVMCAEASSATTRVVAGPVKCC